MPNNIWKMFQGIFGMFFLYDIEYFPYFHLVLSFYYITEMAWVQSLSVLVYIEVFVGTPKKLNHRILMDIAGQIRHTYNKERKLAPFVKKLICKDIVLNCYVKIQENCMFPLMFKF